MRESLIHEFPIIRLIGLVAKKVFNIFCEQCEVWIFILRQMRSIAITDDDVESVLFTLMVNFEVADRETKLFHQTRDRGCALE